MSHSQFQHIEGHTEACMAEGPGRSKNWKAAPGRKASISLHVYDVQNACLGFRKALPSSGASVSKWCVARHTPSIEPIGV